MFCLITEKSKFKVVFRQLFCVLIIFILCGCSAEKVIDEKKYTYVASVYVDNRGTEVIENNTANLYDHTANLYDLTTAEMLVDTYIEILSSNGFFEMIEEKTDIPYSAEQMKRMVSYSRVEETNAVNIKVTAPTSEDSRIICDAILEYANVQIMNIMVVGSVKVIEKPHPIVYLK